MVNKYTNLGREPPSKWRISLVKVDSHIYTFFYLGNNQPYFAQKNKFMLSALG